MFGQTWLDRRYVESDYRLREALYWRWWDEAYVKRRLAIRVFWAFLGGRG